MPAYLRILKKHHESFYCNIKGYCVNTIEKFYIYKETVSNNQQSNKHFVTPKKMFETSKL